MLKQFKNQSVLGHEYYVLSSKSIINMQVPGGRCHCGANIWQQHNQLVYLADAAYLCYEFKHFSMMARDFPFGLAVKAHTDDVITVAVHILSSGIAMSGDIHQS